MVRAEDIVFWLLIAGIVAIALWLLTGSPTETGAIVGVSVFIASSEILLWRALFSINRRTAIGFEKVRSDFKIMSNDFTNLKNDIENKHKEIKTELMDIKKLIKKKG